MPRPTIPTLATLLLVACGPTQPSPGDGSSTSADTGPTPTTEPGPASSSSGSIGGTTVVDGTTMLDDGTTTSPIAPDLPPDLPPECVHWADRGCGSTGMRTAVSGTTPLGDFETTVAVFGGNATCQSCEIVPNIWGITMAADPAVIEGIEGDQEIDETLSLRFEIEPFDGPAGRTVGAWLYATRDGVTEQTNADVVVDYVPTVEDLGEPFDPLDAAVVTGTLTAEGDGWSVMGTFAASYCPTANVIYPCD